MKCEGWLAGSFIISHFPHFGQVSLLYSEAVRTQIYFGLILHMKMQKQQENKRPKKEELWWYQSKIIDLLSEDTQESQQKSIFIAVNWFGLFVCQDNFHLYFGIKWIFELIPFGVFP